jgi:hypothetical protein
MVEGVLLLLTWPSIIIGVALLLTALLDGKTEGAKYDWSNVVNGKSLWGAGCLIFGVYWLVFLT